MRTFNSVLHWFSWADDLCQMTNVCFWRVCSLYGLTTHNQQICILPHYSLSFLLLFHTIFYLPPKYAWGVFDSVVLAFQTQFVWIRLEFFHYKLSRSNAQRRRKMLLKNGFSFISFHFTNWSMTFFSTEMRARYGAKRWGRVGCLSYMQCFKRNTMNSECEYFFRCSCMSGRKRLCLC